MSKRVAHKGTVSVGLLVTRSKSLVIYRHDATYKHGLQLLKPCFIHWHNGIFVCYLDRIAAKYEKERNEWRERRNE